MKLVNLKFISGGMLGIGVAQETIGAAVIFIILSIIIWLADKGEG